MRTLMCCPAASVGSAQVTSHSVGVAPCSMVMTAFMGGLFVKLVGVETANVAKRAVRLFHPRRHQFGRSRVRLLTPILLGHARAGAGLWRRLVGGVFVLR